MTTLSEILTTAAADIDARLDLLQAAHVALMREIAEDRDTLVASLEAVDAALKMLSIGAVTDRTELGQRIADLANRATPIDVPLTGRVTDTERRITVLEPEPPAPVSPSGEFMPTGDLPGWELAWSEDFDTDCEEGEFPAAYPTMGIYPTTFQDTSKRGMYDPTIISCHGSVLRKRIHTSPDGVHHVAAIVPELSFDGKWGDVTSGRFAVRFRSDLIPTYKMAWLKWPIMGNKDPLMHGEIDGPEGDLGGLVNGYMHRKGAPNPGPTDQRVFKSGITSLDWHTWVTEWVAGVSVTMFLDGIQLGDPETRGVPTDPMHWVLQTETILDRKVPIDSSATGEVLIDWLAFWTPTTVT